MKNKVLKSRRGETYVDTGVKIMAAVVCGALVLGSVFWILKDTVFANVKSSIVGMFDTPSSNPINPVDDDYEVVPSTGDLWEMEENTLVRYLGPKTTNMHLVIPNEVDGVRVLRVQNTAAGSDAATRYNIFGNTSETTPMTLEISNGIQDIGYGAFNTCSGITGQLNLPDSVRTIGDYAFNKCSGFAGELVLPERLTSIGRTAFQTCGFTGSLTIPAGITELAPYTFNNCSKLNGTLTLPSTIIKIDQQAFAKCPFTGTLTLPANLTEMGLGAFGMTTFTGSLTIPGGVKVIPQAAFQQCPNFNGTLTLPEGLQEIGESAFIDAKFTGALNLPSTLKSIGIGAFQNCTGFTGALNIPVGLTLLNNFAFCLCSGFTSLSLSNTVEKIGNAAFQNCSGFSNILTIPESVKIIEDFAFNHCSNFKNTEIVLPSGLESFGMTHMFYDFATSTCAKVSIAASNPNYKTVDDVLYTKDGSRLLFYPPRKANVTYTLPEGVTDMNELCFSRNTLLKTLVLPNSYIIRTSGFPSSYLNTSWGNGLAIGLYVYTGVTNVEVKADNTRYASADGILYSKDMKSLWYFPVVRTGTLAIPNGVERIEYGSLSPASGTTLYIPASVTYIDSKVISSLKGTNYTITIATDNPKYKVVDNKIVAK